ncbi:MAG TPA: glycosyltransferase family 9 protein [Longimicrobiales bacterium]|nr:glycosyltransferase family 9 protein [Longimicrobiales bacterium]
MERFEDQPLGPAPHIAVFSSTKVGNFVVTTPLLRGLKEKYPGAVVDFFGSELTRGFEEACPHIDFRFSLYGEGGDFLESLASTVAARRAAAGAYDLAINCDEFAELNVVAVTLVRPRYIAGGALAPDLRGRLPAGSRPEHRMLLDDDWNSPAFLARYRDVLGSNYIAEIFCRMAYVETDFFALEVGSRAPSFDVPDVLVHVTTTRGAKMWPIGHWLELLEWMAGRGLTVGLIGSPPAAQRALYNAGDAEDDLLERTALIDLRGRTPLLELAGALERTRALVTVDAGPLHVAAAVGCPTVALFGCDREGVGASPMHLWAPRRPFVLPTRSDETCTVCAEERFRNRECLVVGHPCMSAVAAGQVARLLDGALLGDRPATAAASTR